MRRKAGADALQNPGNAADRLAEAVARLDAALRAEPDSALTLNTRGAVWVLMERDGPAEQDFRKALELSPALADAHANLGALQLRKGLLNEALGSFNTALEQGGEFPLASNGRAAAFFALGDYDRALRDLEIAGRDPQIAQSSWYRSNMEIVLAGRNRSQFVAQRAAEAERVKGVTMPVEVTRREQGDFAAMFGTAAPESADRPAGLQVPSLLFGMPPGRR